MQDSTNFQAIENRVFAVETKNYKSMMLTQSEMALLSKNASEPSAFWEAYEKGGLLVSKTSVAPEKFKRFVVEKGEKKVAIGYKSVMSSMGAPDDLEFESEVELNDVLGYIENRWRFRRTEQQLSPMKATIPYWIGLAGALFGTGFVIYVNTVGGEFRVNVLFILLIKLSEAIGFIGTVLLGLGISGLVVRALIKAYKNPPVEVRLEPQD